MAEFTIRIETTDGIKFGTVETPTIPQEAPFGRIPYRSDCTSILTPAQESLFWDLIDQVLVQNQLGSETFLWANYAIGNNALVGEGGPVEGPENIERAIRSNVFSIWNPPRTP